MSKEYDFLVFIGRFQPLHAGHVNIISTALQKSEKVICLVGSTNVPRTPKNPFTFLERKTMIEETFSKATSSNRLLVVPLPDILYNDPAWIAQIQTVVNQIVVKSLNGNGVTLHGYRDAKIGLIGFKKDGSSYYLKKFPMWDSVNVESQHSTFNSTQIRDNFFQQVPIFPHYVCPDPVNNFLKKFMFTEEFKEILAETTFYRNYKKSWEGSPYPVMIGCSDAVVIQSGHILLVERGERPGKGLLALPGGHKNPDETFRECAVRELREETKISDYHGKIPTGVLDSYIKKIEMFDDPSRSQRGQVITMAHLFILPDKEELFKVSGDDDAAKAGWYELGSLDPEDFHDDHYFIIEKMLGGLKNTSEINI